MKQRVKWTIGHAVLAQVGTIVHFTTVKKRAIKPRELVSGASCEFFTGIVGARSAKQCRVVS